MDVKSPIYSPIAVIFAWSLKETVYLLCEKQIENHHIWRGKNGEIFGNLFNNFTAASSVCGPMHVSVVWVWVWVCTHMSMSNARCTIFGYHIFIPADVSSDLHIPHQLRTPTIFWAFSSSYLYTGILSLRLLTHWPNFIFLSLHFHPPSVLEMGETFDI